MHAFSRLEFSASLSGIRVSRGMFWLGAFAGLAFVLSSSRLAAAEPAREWSDVPALLARIVPPTFPAREFDVAAYGAKPDGKTDSLPAIRRAIAECHGQGGGHVVIGPGEYYVDGPIHLQSNVDLHLADHCTLLFSRDADHYLPAVLTRWEGTLIYNYSPLIYARGAENIAVTGRGTIDGNARSAFPRWVERQVKAQDRTREMNEKGTPLAKRVFGHGSYLRPSMIQPFECRNVLIEGVTLKDSPFWVVHPVFCTNVTVRGVSVDSLTINNDGCDPDSCTDVLIENCFFHTGDDGIAIKAGRDEDAWRDGRDTENVVIRGCRFDSKINGLCIGSEMAAGVRHVFMEDCRVDRGESCIYFKSNRDRGGFIENVRVRRIQVAVSKAAVVRFETNYHSYRGGAAPTKYDDFVIEDVNAGEATAYMLFAEGNPELPIRNVVLRNVTVAHARVPFFLRNIAALRLEKVRVNEQVLPEQPPPTATDVPKLKISI